ncbi:hypothetical protein QNH39_21330 [Neobacillus novalis]|uniref:Uncharacterized protein n=1 Tax=Neobacillus novalis TaxID=220687 RepID=A0AA95SBL6_9BACI|nr:hypothetical protein [Neobacillus novalis]WHY85138.1 hypothetical protein QNH39_21330 [Neobacillus novalis]
MSSLRNEKRFTYLEDALGPVAKEVAEGTPSYSVKFEGPQINIGLGTGKALDIFNNNIIEYNLIRR